MQQRSVHIQPSIDRASREVTAFRSVIQSLLEREAAGARRHLVVLALDGIPYRIAAARWSRARIERMRSVFPPTSSTAWLSALTGLSVEQHGIPGVVFSLGVPPLIDIYRHQGALQVPAAGNLFSDAKALGYVPVGIAGDLNDLECTWRELLLEHARRISAPRLFAAQPPLPAAAIRARMAASISSCLQQGGANPQLIWCFANVDQRVHLVGYDDQVLGFLEQIESLALQLIDQGALVVAHSDHGLVPTRHVESMQRVLAQTMDAFTCTMGGAGRTRWFYCPAETQGALMDWLRVRLPSEVRVCEAADYFPRTSLAYRRVGSVLVIAEGTDFVTFDGHCFDHGSLMDDELFVPCAYWGA